MAKPTRNEAEQLLQAQKSIDDVINWHMTPQGWRLNVSVQTLEYPEDLRLVGFIGKTNHSFALLYHNCPIRKYTRHAPHEIGGVLYYTPHKHVWNGEDENSEAYVPDNINPSDNINQQFLDFCQECNIELSSGYQWVSYETMR